MVCGTTHRGRDVADRPASAASPVTILGSATVIRPTTPRDDGIDGSVRPEVSA